MTFTIIIHKSKDCTDNLVIMPLLHQSKQIMTCLQSNYDSIIFSEANYKVLIQYILKGDHLRNIPAKIGLIWFSGVRGGDLNVKA